MPEDFIDYARRRANLAMVYLDDGAPSSALRVLEDLVEKVRACADARAAALVELYREAGAE